MGEAKRKREVVARLIAHDNAGRPANPDRTSFGDKQDLPDIHYDIVRATEHQIFPFLAHDLERLATSPTLRLQDILPPVVDSQAEVEYLTGFLRAVSSRPEQFGVTSQESARTLIEAKTREYRSLLAFEATGRKTFYFSETLTEALSYTSLPVPAEMLRLPVDGVAFIYHSEVATEILHLVGNSPITAEYAGSVITVYLREDDLPEHGFRRLLITVYETKGGKQLAYYARSLALRPAWSLEQALQTDWKIISEEKGREDLHKAPIQMRTGSLGERQGPSHEELDMAAFLDDGVRFFRMVLNSVLYVTSRSAQLASKLSNRPIQFLAAGARLAEHRRQDFPFVEVGRDLESIPVVIDPLKKYDGAAPQTFLDRRRLKVRFIVPGFYRRPPGSSPTAMPSVWVRPHYRGPEIADLLNRPYVVL